MPESSKKTSFMNDKEIAKYLKENNTNFEDHYVTDYREKFGVGGEAISCTNCSKEISPDEMVFTPEAYTRGEMKPYGYGEALCASCAVDEMYLYNNGYYYKIALLKKFGLEVGGWLYDQFDEIEDYLKTIDVMPYVDNVRVAEVGNKKQEREYKKKAQQGCCGFTDKEVTHEPTGRTFKIGCNWGH